MGNDVSKNIHENYVIRQKQLGKGTYGTVHKGVRKSDKLRVAVKVLKKKHILQKASLVEKLEREVLIMQGCDHENVVKFFDVAVSKNFVFIVIEYMPGGDLLEYLNQRGRPINAAYTARYMKQALTGLQYLHGKEIAHRDIKPENLLLTADRQTIKLADFGLSHQSSEDNPLFYTMCGSLTHIAPEVFQGKGYDHRVDIWAMGVVLFVMLSVSYPFQHDDRNQLIQLILKGNIDFSVDPIWELAPIKAKDLIQLMLNTDPDQRITLEQCLAHKFINPNAAEQPKRVDMNKQASPSPVAHFKRSKKLAKSRSMALMKAPDPNEAELEEIGLTENDPEEEKLDAEKIAKQMALAQKKEDYMDINEGVKNDEEEEEVEAADA